MPRPKSSLYKVMLLGDSYVGKTSILLRFADNNFSENFVSTIGIDFRIKKVEIDGREIQIQCWDTAGQERFHSLNLSYYRDVDGFIVVFDITNESSFNNVENWLRGISEAATKDFSSILLGSKLDLEDQRVISSQKGAQLAKKHNMPYFETSALTNTNIEESFMELARIIASKSLPQQPKEPEPEKIDLQSPRYPKELASSKLKCC